MTLLEQDLVNVNALRSGKITEPLDMQNLVTIPQGVSFPPYVRNWTSSQETERVYSYNPGARTGGKEFIYKKITV